MFAERIRFRGAALARIMVPVFVAGLLGLAGCSDTAPADEAATATAPTPIYSPIPRYDQRDGNLFMYVGELSAEAKERGERTPIATIRYLGEEDGEQRLERVADDGSTLFTIACSKPCRVAKFTDSGGKVTRVAVDEGTILAAALEDAFNGLLTVATQSGRSTISKRAEAIEPAVEDETTPDWRGKRGTCRLIVSGTPYIRGDCWIRMEGEGSFQIMSLDEQYFAQLSRSGSEASGFWNETPGSTHAQTALGEMQRSGACWKNGEAEICAWDTQ